MPPQPPVENTSSSVDLPYHISPPSSPRSSSSSTRRLFGGSSTGGRGSNSQPNLGLSREERIFHSSYTDEDGSSTARSIASQRTLPYDNRSINQNNTNSKAYDLYGPSVGHDSFVDRIQSSPGRTGSEEGIGRRIGKAVRRMSGGHLSNSNIARFVDLLDGDTSGNNLSLDVETDDTTYDDNVYGAVIHDQERLMEQRHSRKNVCVVCLMFAMIAAFVVAVYGITVHSRSQGGIDSISAALSGITGAFGRPGGDFNNEDTSIEEETLVKEVESTSSPTTGPTDEEDLDQQLEEEVQEDLPLDVSAKLPPPPVNLSSVCAPSSVLTAEGKAACQNLCQPARCCFIEAHGILLQSLGCRESRLEDCQVYEDLCSVLDLTVDGGKGSGDEIVEGEGMGDITIAKELTEAVEQACLFPEEGDTDSCERVCSSGRCCYDDVVPCPRNMDCSVYKPCQSSIAMP